jgi:hypothetical protein
VVLEFPSPLEPVTHVRSTLLTSSLASLKKRDLFARYDAQQTSRHRDAILSCIAGEWLGIDVARAHYEACDGLGLSVDEQIEIGKDVSGRIHETFLALVVKAARGIGVTPWLLLSKNNVLVQRLCQGGGVRIVRLGAQSARIELALNPLLDVPYFRNAMVGVYAAGVELLASGVSSRILQAESKQPSKLTVLRLEWGSSR